MKYCLLLILALFSCIPTALGKIELRYRQIRTTDGLANNSVRTMYQDSKGFLWFGTFSGLSRYDGNSFLNFQLESNAPNQLSLSDNRIYDLAEDSQNFLWIGTAPELYSCYDLQRARFVDFTGNPETPPTYSDFFLASNGDVWLWSKRDGARQVIHGEDRTFTSVEYKTENGNLPDNRIRFVKEDATGRIWIGTLHGLASVFQGKHKIEDRKVSFIGAVAYKQGMYFLTAEGDIYHTSAGKVSRLASIASVAGKTSPTGNFLHKDRWIILTDAGVYDFHPDSRQITKNTQLDLKHGKVLQDNRKDYWIYNHTGVLHYVAAGTEEVKKLQLIPTEKVGYIDYERYHVVHDSRGIIWISTYGNGLFAYQPDKDELEHFTADIDDSGPISSDFLLNVLEDRSGGIWVSSEYSGLSRISTVNEGITRIFPESSKLVDRSNAIRMLSKTGDDDIWIGTRKGGLYNFDSRMRARQPARYFNSNVYVVAKDSHGQYWTGTRGEGLKIGDTWYRNIPQDPTSLSHNLVYSILHDRKGRMWIGTFGGGLNLAEPTADGKYKFRSFLQQKYALKSIRAIAEDKNGMIWVGTSEGLCIFHPDSLMADADKYHLFNYSNGTFCSNEIRCLYQSKAGEMWVGTSGAGLNLCRPNGDYTSLQYDHYGTAEGLANNVVLALREDVDGNMWIATDYGISRFIPQNKSFESYFFSSYTLGNVYTENCACTAADGKLLFGTNYGLTVIDPRNIPANETFSPIVLTGLSINGIQMTPETENSPLEKSLAYSDEITLKYFQSSFVLNYSTLNYAGGKQAKYRYWLENYDREWGSPTLLNFAAYKYLKPGTYIFHIQACNEAGTWGARETTLKIIIAPPFWQTGWAMTGYILLSLVALYFIYRITRNFNRLRTRIHVEKQLTEYKLLFFTNISHEFRTPLALIQAALEKMQRCADLPRELASPLHTMTKGTQRMLRLTNQFLEFRRMQDNKLSLLLEETDIIAFLKEICRNFREMAGQKGMEFRFHSSVPSYRMFIDRGKVDKVGYNLLSNAFKYTPSHGSIHFDVEVDEAAGQLIIRVTDTGVGIPKEKQPELFKRFMQSNFSNDSIGIGLHLTHELVTTHRGTITYHDREGGGSVFTVGLPTDKSVYGEKDFLVPNNVLLQEAREPDNAPLQMPARLLPADPSAPLNKRRVLVIEDDVDVLRLLEEEIGAYFEVETAEDGETGLEKAGSYAPDLIVCDVMMPGMSGFDVTRKLKNDFATSHLPVILLTALNAPEKQLEGIESGADAYISKPFSLKYLMTRIFRLMEQREKLREKFCREPGLVHTAMCTTNRDKEFAERLTVIIEANIARPEFSIEDFALLMRLSRTAFYTKVRGITGYSPVEYLRIIRLKKAAELLLDKEDFSVSEVGYKVGFSDPFYFSKCFKSQFGLSPSTYKKGGGAKSEKQ